MMATRTSPNAYNRKTSEDDGSEGSMTDELLEASAFGKKDRGNDKDEFKDWDAEKCAYKKAELLQQKRNIEDKIQHYYQRGDDKKLAELEKLRVAVEDSLERMDIQTKLKATKEEDDRIEAEMGEVMREKRKLKAKIDKHSNNEKKVAKLKKESAAMEARMEKLNLDTQVNQRMAKYLKRLAEKKKATMEKESRDLNNSLSAGLDLQAVEQQLNKAKDLLNDSALLEDTDFLVVDDMHMGLEKTSKDDETFASTMGSIKAQKALEEQQERENIMAMKKKKMEKKKLKKSKSKDKGKTKDKDKDKQRKKKEPGTINNSLEQEKQDTKSTFGIEIDIAEPEQDGPNIQKDTGYDIKLVAGGSGTSQMSADAETAGAGTGTSDLNPTSDVAEAKLDGDTASSDVVAKADLKENKSLELLSKDNMDNTELEKAQDTDSRSGSSVEAEEEMPAAVEASNWDAMVDLLSDNMEQEGEETKTAASSLLDNNEDKTANTEESLLHKVDTLADSGDISLSQLDLSAFEADDMETGTQQDQSFSNLPEPARVKMLAAQFADKLVAAAGVGKGERNANIRKLATTFYEESGGSLSSTNAAGQKLISSLPASARVKMLAAQFAEKKVVTGAAPKASGKRAAIVGEVQKKEAPKRTSKESGEKGEILKSAENQEVGEKGSSVETNLPISNNDDSFSMDGSVSSQSTGNASFSELPASANRVRMLASQFEASVSGALDMSVSTRYSGGIDESNRFAARRGSIDESERFGKKQGQGAATALYTSRRR